MACVNIGITRIGNERALLLETIEINEHRPVATSWWYNEHTRTGSPMPLWRQNDPRNVEAAFQAFLHRND